MSYLEQGRTLSYGCHIFDTRCKSKSGNSDKGDGTWIEFHPENFDHAGRFEFYGWMRKNRILYCASWKSILLIMQKISLLLLLFRILSVFQQNFIYYISSIISRRKFCSNIWAGKEDWKLKICVLINNYRDWNKFIFTVRK